MQVVSNLLKRELAYFKENLPFSGNDMCVCVLGNNILCQFVTGIQNVKSTWHIMQEYWPLQECGSILGLLRRDTASGQKHCIMKEERAICD